MARAVSLFLMAALTGAASAQTVDSFPFRAVLSANNVAAPPVDPNGSGIATIWLHVVRDANGNITSGSFDYSASYKFAVPVTITLAGIEATYPGSNGAPTGIVFPVTLNLTNAAGAGSIPTSQAQFTSVAAPAIQALLAGTGSFFFNIRTTGSPAGAAGGLLVPANFTVTMGLMSGANAVPPVQGTNAAAVAAISALRTLDEVGNITSAYLIFDINYTGFTAATSLTGLSLGFAGAGQTSTVAIDSGLAAPAAVNSSGAGNLHYETEVDLTRAHAMDVIYTLFDGASNAYVNLSTVASPTGALRAQLSSTDDMVFPVILMPAPSLNLTVSAPATIHARTIRAPDGSIPAGVVLFDVDPLFTGGCAPGCTTFTSLEIRNGSAPASGPVSIDTSLNAQPILTSNGVGNLSRSVTVSAGVALAALQDLVLFPENHYVELETAIQICFDLGEVRSVNAHESERCGGDLRWVADGADRRRHHWRIRDHRSELGPHDHARRAMRVALIAPEIYSDAVGAIVVKQADWSLVRPSNPAHAGDILVIYATGFGQTTPPLNAGVVVPSQPYYNAGIATVSINGPAAFAVQSAYYSLAAPGSVGVNILAFQMPPVGSGTATLQIIVGAGGTGIVPLPALSNTTSFAVQ